MTWLALCDFATPLFSREGLGRRTPANTDATKLGDFLEIGTFVIEGRFEPDDAGHHRILSHHRPGERPLHFEVTISANEGVKVQFSDGEDRQVHRVSSNIEGSQDTVRVTYSWDLTKRWGLLSMENLDSGGLNQVELESPLGFRFDDIEQMSLRAGKKASDNAVSYFGFSSGIEPVGLSACIAPHAPVETPEGPKMIDQLKPGDLILTEDHGEQPVRWVGAREVPARGYFQPIRLRAPYFGLTRDLMVAPEQCLLIGGAEVEYLFGEEEVLVEARHLVNGISALWEKTGPTIRLYHVLLDRHEVIRIAGCQLESLYIGALGTDVALLQTTMLRGIAPEEVPFHAGSARPILRNYEAMTLQSVLAG